MAKWFAASVLVSGLLGGSWVVMAQNPVASTFSDGTWTASGSVFAVQEQVPPGVKPLMPPADKKNDKMQGDVPDPTRLEPPWTQIFAQKGGKGALNAKIPNIVLRGRVLSQDKPPMAIIEVDGRSFIVGKDSMLTGAQTIMKIVELNAAEVRIELGPSNEIIILR